MSSTGRERDRKADRDRERRQDRARLRTEQLRQQLDLLADPDTFETFPAPGPGSASAEPDQDDQTDGDALLEEAEEEGGEQHEETGTHEVSSESSLSSLGDVLGALPPVALVHVAILEEAIHVRPLVRPRARTREALEELCRLLEGRFQEGRRLLTPQEWNQLIGREPVSITARLVLLARLAIAGQTQVPLPGGASFVPNNRGLERYVGKLALLPDGTPFSIRLLLKGSQSGRRSQANPDLANHPFGRLPEAVKLLALRRALRQEKLEGQARNDEEFRALLGNALLELGLPMKRPFWKHVEMLRSSLKRKGLGEIFPNAAERQKQYQLTNDQ